jgi:hypothetical protein
MFYQRSKELESANTHLNMRSKGKEEQEIYLDFVALNQLSSSQQLVNQTRLD